MTHRLDPLKNKLFDSHHHWRGTKQKRSVRRAFKNPTKPEGQSCSVKKDCLLCSLFSPNCCSFPHPIELTVWLQLSAYTCTQNIWMHICLQHRQPPPGQMSSTKPSSEEPWKQQSDKGWCTSLEVVLHTSGWRCWSHRWRPYCDYESFQKSQQPRTAITDISLPTIQEDLCPFLNESLS